MEEQLWQLHYYLEVWPSTSSPLIIRTCAAAFRLLSVMSTGHGGIGS
jgi:hypothetical protein